MKKENSKQVLTAPRGMHDILPFEQAWWDRVNRAAREIADFYGFGKIDTPILEHSSIFERGVGVDTDLVGKEMYIVKTRGGDTLAMRPENTAGVMRSYMEHHLGRGAQPQKFFYSGPFSATRTHRPDVSASSGKPGSK
ncbi:MAG: ATP phosphoribosyltransferase regulatory subunit [Candidatus Liptonbacteria bacterium]